MFLEGRIFLTIFKVNQNRTRVTMQRNLTVNEVAKIAGCHRNTVLRYEREGYIKPMRDLNNFRRYSRQDAAKLRDLLTIRNPAK